MAEIFSSCKAPRSAGFSENLSIHSSPLKNSQYCHSLKHLREFGAPKDFPEFSRIFPRRNGKIFSSPEASETSADFSQIFLFIFPEWKISKISIFSKRLRKFGAPKDFPEFSLEGTAKSFHRMKHPKPRLTFPKSFYLSFLSGKSPRFLFSASASESSARRKIFPNFP